jgi:hypothetical protein
MPAEQPHESSWRCIQEKPRCHYVVIANPRTRLDFHPKKPSVAMLECVDVASKERNGAHRRRRLARLSPWALPDDLSARILPRTPTCLPDCQRRSQRRHPILHGFTPDHHAKPQTRITSPLMMHGMFSCPWSEDRPGHGSWQNQVHVNMTDRCSKTVTQNIHSTSSSRIVQIHACGY